MWEIEYHLRNCRLFAAAQCPFDQRSWVHYPAAWQPVWRGSGQVVAAVVAVDDQADSAAHLTHQDQDDGHSTA